MFVLLRICVYAYAYKEFSKIEIYIYICIYMFHKDLCRLFSIKEIEILEINNFIVDKLFINIICNLYL